MRPATIVDLFRRRPAIVGLAVAAALVATATAVAATSALPPPQVLNYQLYVGGKGKANPKLSPVTIGYINGQGGPPNFNFPQGTHVTEAGVKMVNAELGGVHGHPLKLNECFWAQAEEEGVRCGQQMVNNAGTKAILFGFVTVGNQSIYATVKGTKPIIAGVTANPADPTAKNAYFLNGSQTSVLGPFGTYTKRFLPKVKTRGHRLSDRSGRRHRRARPQEGHGADRSEDDGDRGAAALDRPARSRRRRRARPT